MTKLYLITGFLGAGKTTFLKKFVRLFPEKKIALIINEFGANGVDGALLQDLGAAMREIDNGSIFCSCRAEQFEHAVTELLEHQKPDLIFVEASGLADPSAVRSIFTQPIYNGMEYAGALCIVDAARFHKVYKTARVSRMQLAVSDLVLVNKTDLASREQIEEILSIVKGQKPDRPVFETAYGEFDPAWLQAVEAPALCHEPAGVQARDITLSRITLEPQGFDLVSLTAFLKMFAEDTYRIKGFVELDGVMYLADCVGPLVEVSPYEGKAENPGKLTVLFGNGLPARKSIREALTWYPDCSANMT